jgi:hypothetical protein
MSLFYKGSGKDISESLEHIQFLSFIYFWVKRKSTGVIGTAVFVYIQGALSVYVEFFFLFVRSLSKSGISQRSHR